MPENAVPEKLDAVAALGAHVVKDGVTSSTIAFERAAELQRRDGLTLVHPFDDPYVIAGAATATLELLEDEPASSGLYVPCSGGGLIAGAVLAARAADSPVEVIGVQPEGSDGIVRSLAAGEPVAVPTVRTIADGLTAPRPGAHNLAILREAQVRVLLVDDDAILDAMRTLVTTLRVVSSRRPRPGWHGSSARRGRQRTAALLLSGFQRLAGSSCATSSPADPAGSRRSGRPTGPQKRRSLRARPPTMRGVAPTRPPVHIASVSDVPVLRPSGAAAAPISDCRFPCQAVAPYMDLLFAAGSRRSTMPLKGAFLQSARGRQGSSTTSPTRHPWTSRRLCGYRGVGSANGRRDADRFRRVLL
jgi:hypothetical protein